MDLMYIWTVILFAMVLVIAIPIAFRSGRARQKAIDISERPPVVGTILIETRDADGPYLFLDLHKPVDYVGSQTEVVCKIDTNGVLRDDTDASRD